MHSRDYFYEVELKRYVVLYFLLGVVEHEFRARVPIVLSDAAFTLGKLDWWEVLPQTPQNVRSIKRAIEKNGDSAVGFEQKLPFSFWRFIFVGENYLTLWNEYLQGIFPSLERPLEKRSYDQICNRIYRAYELRNKVAHYEFLAVQRFENEKRGLLWLIHAMGGPSA